MTTDLAKLAKPFPQRLIKAPPKGKYGSYVEHNTVNEKLLATVGPFDFEVREIVRGAEDKVEAVIGRLTCTIDGKRVSVDEVGDCENPSNWKTEGGRLKDAISDCLKRCAMRIGCGLHLWSGEDFQLYDVLLAGSREVSTGSEHGPTTPPGGGKADPASASPSAESPAERAARLADEAAKPRQQRQEEMKV